MKFLSIFLILALIAGLTLYYSKKSSSTNRKKAILLLGPPGSGKGTQAVTLASDLKIPHISTGDLFRQNIRDQTPLGKEVQSLIASGKLVSDDIVLKILFDRLAQSDCESGFLLDGFPRTIPQAESLANSLDKKFQVMAINLDVKDDTIVKRAEGRLTCKDCGYVHNKYFSPPAIEGKCDKCNGELVQRPDDRMEVVQERLKIYHDQSKPLINYYKEKGFYKNINGEMNKEAVYAALKNALIT